MATASLLCGTVAAHAADTVPPPVAPQSLAEADGDDDDDESEDRARPGQTIGLLVVDNSSRDSILEVDRTFNTLFRSKGTAGSDHDGGGGAIDVRSQEEPGPGTAAVGHPPWQGEGSE
ncbi:hypothetical protein [Streptomyces liangshanensis]|uniref:hypothetical protein n=1 Tax=Streptomyces liangshanensis TaxID=2717324 RepID=UPI0036DD212D